MYVYGIPFFVDQSYDLTFQDMRIPKLDLLRSRSLGLVLTDSLVPVSFVFVDSSFVDERP